MFGMPFLGGRRCLASAVFFCLVAVAACDDDDEPVGPDLQALELEVLAEADSLVLTWIASARATSYRAELRTNLDTVSQTLPGDATSVVFTGLPDEVTYDAQAFAISAAGERGSEVVQVTMNHFPWDEYYPTSLHFTRIGKETWYGESSGGFQAQMGVPYADLYAGCQGCHRSDQALGTNGCESCHDTPDPQLGAEVDATLSGVCGGCHNRSVYEVDHGYQDYHRDVLGFTCMDCHTMGDVHGDGTPYESMLEEGAIDAKCENCHSTLADNMYHSRHSETVSCAMCHMQTVISCYNCHMEMAIETPPVKKARRRILNWMFMVNRDGKVHPANVATLQYKDETFVAIAPYFSHTIVRDAVSICTDCHMSANMQDLTADNELVVADYDPATRNVVPLQGIIPVPPDYESALKFDFLTYDPTTDTWSLLKENGPDRFQMLYASPLTDAQINKLK